MTNPTSLTILIDMNRLFIMIVLGALIFGIGGGYLIKTEVARHSLVPAIVGKTLSQDPVLLDDAEQLGLDYSNVNLSFATSLSAPDVVGTKTIGLFTPPNSIQVQLGMDKKQELQTVAYEFMHYYWQNLSADQKSQLASTYRRFYDNSYSFQQATKYIVGNAATLADERNSTACTVMPPYVLTDEFNAYCNQLIPNRSIIF